ncbi:MAG: response regulator [Candidatus Poribacteria bacterium]
MNLRFTIIIIILILIPTIQVNSIEIKDIRFSTESLKTRIVFELDEKAQYEAKYDKEKNILISILKTNLADLNKPFTLNNKLVKNLTVKQSDSDTNVKISLEKLAGYKIFTIKFPERIVIDIAPIENLLTPEVIELSPEEIEAMAVPISVNKPINKTVEPVKSDNSNSIAKAETTVASIEPPVRLPMELTKESPIPDVEPQSAAESQPADEQSANWLSNIDYQMLSLYCFDLIVIAFMISMVFRIKAVYKFTNGLVNERLAFANMINGIKEGHKQDDEKQREKEEWKKADANDDNSADKIDRGVYTKPKIIPKQHKLASNRGKLLVIDDKEAIFNLVSLVSQSHGYEAIYASSEEEGLAKANNKNPSLIFINLSASAIEVPEVCEKLKADRNTEKISIIMIIGENTGEAILRARELGADDYIVKPFTRRQLLEKIDKHLGGTKVKKLTKFLGGLLYQS